MDFYYPTSFKRTIDLVIETDTLPLSIKDLRVDFSIESSVDPEPNRANFVVFNLSEPTRNAIKTEKVLQFSAGYAGVPMRIFSGSIVGVKNRRVPGGWETEIEALDGHGELKAAKFDKSFAAGTPLMTIVTAMAASLGLPFELGFIPANDSIIVGTTYSGSTFACLTRLCKQLKLEWSIQSGILQISDKGYPVTSAMAQVVLLSPDTGLVGSPVVTMDESPEPDKPIGSIEAVALLNGALLPNKPVKIMPANPMTFAGLRAIKNKMPSTFSVAANGLYRIEHARFVGSNNQGSFLSEISCPIWG